MSKVSNQIGHADLGNWGLRYKVTLYIRFSYSKPHNARLSKQAASSNTVDRSHQATTLVLRERSSPVLHSRKHVGRNLRSIDADDKSPPKVFYSSASSWNLSISDWSYNFVSSIYDHNPAQIYSFSHFFSLMPALARPNKWCTAVMNEKNWGFNSIIRS